MTAIKLRWEKVSGIVFEVLLDKLFQRVEMPVWEIFESAAEYKNGDILNLLRGTMYPKRGSLMRELKERKANAE